MLVLDASSRQMEFSCDFTSTALFMCPFCCLKISPIVSSSMIGNILCKVFFASSKDTDI